MTARQGELLEKPKRRLRGQLMHVCDAGECFESLIAVFHCRKCGYESKWLKIETVTKAKRGLPCPICNKESS
jgi:predicted Zn-ribbon and HTH transcriptional regulator